MSYPPPPGYGGYPPQGGYGGYAGPPPSNGMATAGLVTGIISMLCLAPLALVAIPLSIAGISKANSINGIGKGQAIGGLITGIIGLLWGVAFTFMVIAGVGFFATQVDDLTCRLNRTSLETAVESFQTIEQRDPVDEAELVRENYLTSEVDTHDFSISSDGIVTVRATSGEGCD